MSDGAELRLDRVSAGYGPTRVVDDMSWTVEASRAMVVLGRNGAGKTTLVRAIAGWIPVQHGTIHLGERRIEHLGTSERCRRGIGLVPQDRQVFRSLTVDENLRVADLGKPSAAADVFDLFPGLAERRHTYAGRLSGGEQQMLAIGRALMGQPRCLILDEPFEGLAPLVVDAVLSAIERIRREHGPSIVMVEQQHAKLALDVADCGVVMERGRVRLSGTRAELADRWSEVEALLAVS